MKLKIDQHNSQKFDQSIEAEYLPVSVPKFTMCSAAPEAEVKEAFGHLRTNPDLFGQSETVEKSLTNL